MLATTLVLLAVVDAWTVSAIVTGLVRGEGEGSIFVSAIVALGAIAAVMTYLAYRVARKLRAGR